ncbi:hypothetical protein HUT09_35910 (plasmid) [Streptomyces microflavus]|uniref:Uncharacterized protein n=1 Tax=Streptomyces microflavus TaxID=1919 RepID=A0A7H8N0A7_STRMI|nr:hypothetical protein HUT09_35910 [Streptomyces microflavus]
MAEFAAQGDGELGARGVVAVATPGDARIGGMVILGVRIEFYKKVGDLDEPSTSRGTARSSR